MASCGLCHFLRVASSGLCHFGGWLVQDSVVFLHSGPYDKNKAESGEHQGEEETDLAPGAGAPVQDPRLGAGSEAATIDSTAASSILGPAPPPQALASVAPASRPRPLH